MRRSLLGPVLLLCAGALLADDVRLHNGKTFEGVVVAERDGTLDLQVPGGTISIPRTSVREIVASDSPYTEYLNRAAELRRIGAGASRWVELARWASARQMDTAAREAILAAATLDPMLADVAPMMRAFGYELDAPTRRWLPFEEAMRSRGLVLVDGSWLSPEEAAELRRREEEAARERRRDLEAERVERAAAQMRLAAAEMEWNRANSYGYGGWPAYDGWGIPYVPYVWPVGVPPVFNPGNRADRPRPSPHGAGGVPYRIDGRPAGGATHGGVARQPGTAGRGTSSSGSASIPNRR
jgi:hypothetical protein